MRETVLTLAAATLCAAFLQMVDAKLKPASAAPVHGGQAAAAR